MLLVLLLPEFTFATHISGADLTYRWVSGNTYELTLALYRDCSGISAPTNVTITYSSVTCGVNSTVTINKKPGTGNEISMVCSTAVTTCSGGTYPGFQKWEYVGNVTLPNQCPDWVFGYSICCRNCAITTLSYTPNNCTGVPATYIEATLNNLVVPNNSAPSFTNIPVLFFCIGQTIHFNHGAYDSDGDSLVYSWITPRSAAGTNVVFKPGYSASSPLSSSPAITLDNSGDITISPTALEVGVMAILVKEYRNGVLVGSVVRDMEVWTQSCTNIFPTATGANGTTSYDLVACPGKPFSFYVNSTDPNSGQVVSMTYNGNIPGATFTTTGAPYPQGVFTWTPTIGQARSQPYSFLLTVQDNNCPMNGFQTYSYTILVPPLSATTSGVNATCAVPPNGSVSVTPTGSAPFTYLWSPTGSTGSNLSGIGSGTYTVTVTDKYGCTTTATRAITQPTPVSVVVTPTATTCGLANGTAVASASGGTGPYTYNWLPDHQTNSSHTGMAAGNYSVIITDANGCTTSAATTVTANTPPAITIASGSNVSCFAGNNGSASALVSGGQSPFTYNWSPSGGAMASASSLSAGSYSVQVTDANGCTSVAAVTISQPTALSATPSVHDGTCAVNNGSASVSVSGGTSPYTYLWTPGSSTSSSISSLSSGAYSVRVTDAHGCSSTISMSVGNSGIMSGLAISTSSVSCHGGNDAGANISFTGGTPPYTYTWSPGGSTTSSVTGLHSGNYTCVVTDAYGCTQSASATITEPAAILLSTASSTNVSCSGMNDGSAIATASGGTTPYTFIWQGYPVNGPVMNNIYAGSYNVVVTDANGCQTNSVAVISEPTSLSLLSNVTPATCGSSNGSAHVQVSGGTPPYSYSWSNGQTTSTATGLAAGSYDVTVTDSHNCTLQVSVGVSNLNGPSANLSFSTDARCFGSADGSAGVTVSGGTPPFTYQWSSGGSITSTAYNLSAGSHTVVITDANNCVTTVPVQISQPAVIAPQLSASDVSCYNGSNGQISLTVNGGTPPYSYLWSNSALTSSIVNLQAGNYSVQITDANGCTSTLATAINQPGALSVALSASDVRCSGGNDGFVSVSASGGTQPYSFLWPSSGTTASLDNGLPAGSYSVVITDANGCTLTGTTTVHEPLPLTLSSSVIDGTCGAANGTGNIIAGGGTAPYSYYWSFNGSTASSQNALPQGVYNVLVTDDYGCTNSIDIAVGNSGSMTATVASVSSVSCHSGANASAAISLNGGTPPFNYSWTPGNFSAPVVSGLTAGNYTCIVTDAHSCTQSVSVYIDEPQELVAASTVVTQYVVSVTLMV
ncbi:MAG: SprB repeat-containing protein [Bacteroidia bacterium]